MRYAVPESSTELDTTLITSETTTTITVESTAFVVVTSCEAGTCHELEQTTGTVPTETISGAVMSYTTSCPETSTATKASSKKVAVVLTTVGDDEQQLLVEPRASSLPLL